jgi:glycerol-3-phosphate dehydrogenase
LSVASRTLMGGTKGSHFLTFQPRLAKLLARQAIYTEARDGRPVFVLPFLEGTLVGTTDIPFAGDPATAVATPEELDYLLAAVDDLFPDAGLTRGDIAMHYCGVRPLPAVDAKAPAAITRRHQLVWSDQSKVPLVSLVGGKLTTCRSLAEETAAAVLKQLGTAATANSQDRPIPKTPVDDCLLVEPSAWKVAAQWAVEHEWVARLEDLVERRLMWHFSPELTIAKLSELADIVIQQGRMSPGQKQTAIDRCVDRLTSHFGIRLNPEP